MDNTKKNILITTSNRIRRKNISLINKLYNNKNHFEKNKHLLENIDFLFSLIENKIKEIHLNINENKTVEKNEILKKKDIEKLLPIFCYYLYYDYNLNDNSIESID